MKLAFEKEAEDTGKKAGGSGAGAGSSTASGSLPATPKRKRGTAVPGGSSAKKNKATPKKLADGDGVFKPEPVSDEDGEGVEETPRKRGRGAGKAAKGKKVKTEPVDDDGVMAHAVDDSFLAAPPAFRGFEGGDVPFRGFDVGEEEDTFFDAREEVGSVGVGGMDEEQLDCEC